MTILPFVRGDEEDEATPTATDAISQVLLAEGDLNLAAERLFGYQEGGRAKAQLIALLAEDPSTQQDLQRMLRTLAMLQAFQTFKDTALVVSETLDRIDANARATFMNRLAQTIAVLTDDHTTTSNTNSTSLSVSLTEQVMKSLSPDVQQAIRALQAPVDVPNESPEVDQVLQGQWGIVEGDLPGLGDPPPNAAVGTDGE